MRDLGRPETWERGYRPTLAVYRATASFPQEETYGITGQMRVSRAATPANTAEGRGWMSDAGLAAEVRALKRGPTSFVRRPRAFANSP